MVLRRYASLCLILTLMIAQVIHAQRPGPRGSEPAGSPDWESGISESAPKIFVPNLIRVGGVLKQLEGKPLARPVDVAFSLYENQEGEDPIWSETQSVQAGPQGQYTLLLGVMHPEGLPLELFSSGKPR